MFSVDQSTDGYSAVFLMEGAQVARQMRASEFGAFLDGYVGLSDLADTDARAVYVLMGKDLLIRSLVFFHIYFDEEGRADSHWNLPVEQLALKGAKGPDLGAGPIRLVCRSQCPASASSDELWDPDMTPGSNHFQAVRKAATANALKFQKVETAEVEENIPILRSELIKPATATEDPEAGLQRTRLARMIREQRLRIKTLQSVHRDALTALQRENHNLRHREPPDESLMKQLHEQSVFLVAYHAGVGHITLPFDDIERYFESPIAYAAQKCGLDEPAYQEWFAHYEKPVCLHKLNNNKPCGQPLLRVSEPYEFVPGQGDRCEEHRVTATQTV